MITDIFTTLLALQYEVDGYLYTLGVLSSDLITLRAIFLQSITAKVTIQEACSSHGVRSRLLLMMKLKPASRSF